MGQNNWPRKPFHARVTPPAASLPLIPFSYPVSRHMTLISFLIPHSAARPTTNTTAVMTLREDDVSVLRKDGGDAKRHSLTTMWR